MGDGRTVPARIATLDLLRLVAALAVVAFHYLFRGAAAGDLTQAAYPGAAPVALYGYLGVNLFFLISGFVIAWSAEGRSWEAFAIARFARLYPGYLACMTVTFLVTLLAVTPFNTSAWQYAANLIMFSPALGQPFMDGVYWSIVLEVVFYGWVAVSLLAGVFERWKLPLVTAWLAICLVNEQFVGSGAARMVLLTEFGPYFAAGILVHHIHSRGRSPDALLLLLAAFLISCNTMLVTRDWMIEHYGQAVPVPALFLANLVMYALLAAAVRWRELVRPGPAVLMLGGLTYPLYLLHQHIGYAVINAAMPLAGRWAAAGIAIIVMLALSWAVWRFVETPSRRRIVAALNPLAERMLSRLRPQRVPAAE